MDSSEFRLRLTRRFISYVLSNCFRKISFRIESIRKINFATQFRFHFNPPPRIVNQCQSTFSFSVGFSLVQQVHFSLFQDFFPPRSYPPPSRFFKREIPPLSSSRPFFSRLKKIIYKSSHLSSPFPNPHLSLNKRSSVPLDLPYNLFAPGERQPTSLLARLDQQQLYFFAKNLVVHLSAEYESIFYRFKEFCEFTLSWLEAFYF